MLLGRVRFGVGDSMTGFSLSLPLSDTSVSLPRDAKPSDRRAGAHRAPFNSPEVVSLHPTSAALGEHPGVEPLLRTLLSQILLYVKMTPILILSSGREE